MMRNEVLNIIDKDAYKDAYNIELPKNNNELISEQINNSSSKMSLQPENNINPVENFNRTFEKYIRDPALGFMQGIANIPAEIGNIAKHQYERLQPQMIREKSLPDIPYFDVAPHTLPAQAGEAVSFAMGGKAPAELIAKGFGKVKNILTPISRKSISEELIKKHDPLESKAIEGFEHVSKEAKQRELPPINVDTSQLKDYFPSTKSVKKLLSKAETGDYDALRDVQSDLYTRAKKNLQSDLESERNKGEEMMELRDDINHAIKEHLINTGNEDLANILSSSINDWKTLKNIYYNKNMNNAIKKLVDKDIRKVPENLSEILKEESIPMKNLRNFHPGLEAKIKNYGLQQALLKKYLPLAAISGSIYEYGKK